MQTFLEYVVKGLVDQAEEVQVQSRDQRGQTIYELRMHPDDVGKVIGRKGSTIHALRSLVQVGAAKKGLRCTVEIVETPDSQPEESEA